MHWPTHILIADKIHKIVEEKFEVTLDKKGLKLGSLKPDYSPYLLRIKHLKEKSINNLCEMIENIKNKSMPETGREFYKFSMDLGIIMHYITDFFCFAHNHPKFVNKLQHIKYEWALLHEYKKTDTEETLKKAYANLNHYNEKRYKCLKEFINEMHDEYMANSPGIENDIKYSLEMCMTIALIIFGSVNLQVV